ncbi:MAG: EpsG family protein [Flavobacteriaceae bacterium]|nr:EpsG family protein [Flavobacteriaceae bacterium]
MQTFLIYNFILLGATFFGYLYEKSQNKGTQKLYWCLSFMIPFTFLAIRYDIGTDYQSYVEYFYRIAGGAIVLKEPAYLFINKTIAELGLDVQWLFVIFGFLFTFFAYKALPKKGFAFGVFIFLATMYLYEGLSMLRQGLATVMMAYGIKYIVDRKFIKYLILSIMAMLFHLGTGFIFLLLYPFLNRKFNRWLLLGVLLVTYLIVLKTDMVFNAMSFFVSLFPKYAWYLNSKYMEMATIGTGLGILSNLLLGLMVIFFKDKITKRYENANVVINMYFLYLFFMILHMEMIVLLRLEHMFIFAPAIALPYCMSIFEKRGRLFVVFIVSLLLFAMFNKYIASGTLAIDNDIYINPYQFIWDR